MWALAAAFQYLCTEVLTGCGVALLKTAWGQHLKKTRRLGPTASPQQADTRSSLVERRQWGMKTRSRDQGRTAGVGSVKRTSPGFGAMGEKRRLRTLPPSPLNGAKPTFPQFNPAGAQSPVGVDQSAFAPS